MNIHLQGLYGGKHEDGIKRFASNFPTFQTMPKNAYQSRMKISPTAMTSGTHLNLHREFRSAVHLTLTTMPATEWLRRIRLKSEIKPSIAKCVTLYTLQQPQTTSSRRLSHGEARDHFFTNRNRFRQKFKITG